MVSSGFAVCLSFYLCEVFDYRSREKCVSQVSMRKMQGDAVNDKRLEKGVNCITDSPGCQASCLHVDVFGNIIPSYYELRDVHGPPEKNQPKPK